MSLTTELKPNRPLRRWFNERFPNVKPMQTLWRESGGVSFECPAGVNARQVGIAFDYRLRYYFTEADPSSFVAAQAVKYLSSDDHPVIVDTTGGSGPRVVGGPFWSPFIQPLREVLDRSMPVGRRVSGDTERELARCCLLLARLDAIARGGRVAIGADLEAIPSTAPISDYLALISEESVNDVVALVEAFHSTPLSAQFGQRFVPNPTFAGSLAVGGADADFILGNTLVDIKTVADRSLGVEMIYQLLGYALLDWDDEYGITDVGYYRSRIPSITTWELEEALEAAAHESVTVSQVRNELRAFCRSNSSMQR